MSDNNGNEMEYNMEKYIEKKAIKFLIGILKYEKKFSIQQITKMFIEDIENTETSINKLIDNKRENIDKKQKVTDEQEKSELENKIIEINKIIKEKEKKKEILLKSLEIIKQATSYLQMTVEKCQKVKGKDRVSAQEVEEALLSSSESNQGDFYKEIALIIFKLENDKKQIKEDERKETYVEYKNLDVEEEKKYQEFISNHETSNKQLKHIWEDLMEIRDNINFSKYKNSEDKTKETIEVISVNRKSAKIMEFPNTNKNEKIIPFPNIEDDGREQ